MIVFVKASALVAIARNEPDREELLATFLGFARGFWSPMSCWEAVAALMHSYKMPFGEALADIRQTAAALALTLVQIGEDELDAALDAYARYGKQSRHPARLNMGDCFAYACAKTNAAALLYKGDDFSRTDLA